MGVNSGFKGLSTRPKPSGFFRAKKIPSTTSFGGEVKPSVPCRRFAECKRSLNVTWKSRFRQNYRPTFSPTVPPFAARISRVVWMWRHLAAEVGTSKNHGWVEGGQGSHNKPLGCGASGAYAPGLDDEEEEEPLTLLLLQKFVRPPCYYSCCWLCVI